MSQEVLLLNADYTPLNIITISRALKLLHNEKSYRHPQSKLYKIRTIKNIIEVPRAIILKYYVKTPGRKYFPTRKNILKRDHYICQYCGIEVHGKNATIDHIIPKKRGGGNTWSNLVCACKDCNHFKGNRTPKEANMTLKNKPKEPNIYTFHGVWETIYLEVA